MSIRKTQSNLLLLQNPILPFQSKGSTLVEWTIGHLLMLAMLMDVQTERLLERSWVGLMECKSVGRWVALKVGKLGKPLAAA